MKKESGFTLIEMLVVMVLMASLTVIALRATSGKQEMANDTKARTALVSIAEAAQQCWVRDCKAARIENSSSSSGSELQCGQCSDSGFEGVSVQSLSEGIVAQVSGVSSSDPASPTHLRVAAYHEEGSSDSSGNGITFCLESGQVSSHSGRDVSIENCNSL